MVSEGYELDAVVLKRTTCEWGTVSSDCLTVRVPAGLVAKAGHVPPNGGTAAEEKASIPVRIFFFRNETVLKKRNTFSNLMNEKIRKTLNNLIDNCLNVQAFFQYN